MNLLEPLLGPIVGHTTEESVRLWARGYPRTLGVVRYRRSTERGFIATRTFTISAECDHTGTVDIGGLESGCEYQYQLGFVDPGDDAGLVAAAIESGEITLNWNKQPNWADSKPAANRFRTFPEDGNATTFIVGSCRHHGLGVLRRGDKAFKAIHQRRVQHGEENDFLLMIGDQVYTDMNDRALIWFPLNLLPEPQNTLEGFFGKYQRNYGSRYFRKVLRRTSAYMMMDDHEVVNNWEPALFEGDGKYAGQQHIRDFGLQAYNAYQVSHSPAANTGRYWYQFAHGPCDFFVLDVRSERDRLHSRQIGVEQFEALRSWLQDGSERVKFVVSPVPMFPDTVGKEQGGWGEPEDKWTGFAKQREEILELIRARPNNRTVMLSGDVHCSFIAELKHDHDPEFRCYNVISSAFNWVVFGLRRRDFRIEQPLLAHDGQVSPYRVGLACGTWDGHFHQVNNYARLQVLEGEHGMELRVVYRDDRGALLEDTTIYLDKLLEPVSKSVGSSS